MEADLTRLVAQDDIREVLHRYCRGVDRRQLDLVRSCYHVDAIDHHGPYVGGIEGFIQQLEVGLDAYASTTHLLTNVMIDVDGPTARAESYVVAHHRIPAGGGDPERDFVIGGRYVDDFEQRDGVWRILIRVCVVEWARVDPVLDAAPEVVALFRRGRRDDQDLVFAASLGDLHLDLELERDGALDAARSSL